MTIQPLVVLIGPPGVGKTTVAQELATALQANVRDTDVDVETHAGKAISDIFIEDGEPTFREHERHAVATALTEHAGVLSLGGGAVLDVDSQHLLATYRDNGGVIVFLDVSLAQAAQRVGLNRARPLLLGNPRAQWQKLMTERRPVYEKLASLTINTDELSPQQTADVILAHLQAAAAKDSTTS